jgi:hypothetical protein
MKNLSFLGIALYYSQPKHGIVALQPSMHVPVGRPSKSVQGKPIPMSLHIHQLRRKGAIRDSDDRNVDLAEISRIRPRSQRRRRTSHLLERKQSADAIPVPTKITDAIRVFFFSGDCGPSWIVLCLAGLCYWRLALVTAATTTVTNTGAHPLGWADAGVFGAALLFWWLQEHVLHEGILHSSIDWVGKAVHQGHHDKPYYHVSIDPAALLLGWMTAAHFVLFRWWLPLPLAVSGTFGYCVAGLFYEWAHYIVHSKVRLRSSFWRRVRDNHVRHHRVCSEYWFAFSLPAIDDLFGTNPRVQDVQQWLKDSAKEETSLWEHDQS